MKFFNQVGQLALGSRVRLLGDKFSEDAKLIYEAYDTNLHPKWFPVFYVLSKSESKTASTIAEEIGHSHVSVGKILTEMLKAGLIIEKRDPNDGRSTLVSLSAKAKKIAQKIETQYQDVNAAIDQLTTEAEHNLWNAVEEWQNLLTSKSLLARVIENKKRRESAFVKIENYQPKYNKAFHDLNKQWITMYFKMEKPDVEALENPKKYILDRGGFIFVATIDKKPVGVCALVPHKKNVYELAKMAVLPEARGQNVGWLLGQVVIEKARSLKAKSVYLESNTILEPAIALYRKLGFKEIRGASSPYERCNIQMDLGLG